MIGSAVLMLNKTLINSPVKSRFRSKMNYVSMNIDEPVLRYDRINMVAIVI